MVQFSQFVDPQEGYGVIDYQKEFFEALKAADGASEAEPGKMPPKDDKAQVEKAPPKTAKIDPWIMNMVAGCYYRNLAWHHRGGGWASSVTDEGGRLFQENLTIAEKHFTKAWEINPKLPPRPPP